MVSVFHGLGHFPVITHDHEIKDFITVGIDFLEKAATSTGKIIWI
ncbi:hypothetical protein XNC1_3073 [Xenorhabdus nematophila ATCC 19061]|uniref:Uncharacterized protein n=1 Tax=Xenorhabdus nematophila (strain ATCC 19061 / DSM 3370 / CCUG 14189 / LMG 1036 / NCIMB 9965 / AN6) TaxID=406817 RepID=D3VKL9_XENNA|nr:hypothetical protein XNC1_3073 [Xenorhabdus nematophila ATCC 19061]